MTEQSISIERMEEAVNLFGLFDENIRLIEQELDVSVVNRESNLKISGEGENVMWAVKAIQGLLTLSAKGEAIGQQNVRYIIELVRSGNEGKIAQLAGDVVCVTAKGKPIKAKTIGQQKYVDAIKNNTVTIGVGPAGTGKTYLAVAAAVAAFREKQINRIVLTRPAVEAGESLGFLPGDMKEKVDPYLRPLYDALNEFLGADTVEKYIEKEVIEIAPLAFMRGRTLNDAVVILDEAQNTIQSQMKMFLTRMGKNAQMIINGDVSQIDLIKKKDSGLIQACAILQGIDGIEILYLDQSDVVRNPLVQKIIDRYAQYDL